MTNQPAKSNTRQGGFPSLDLAARLREQLQLDRNEPALLQPILTIVGFSDQRTEVLRRCLDRPEHTIIGFELPSRYLGIGVVASSVIATPPSRSHHDASLALGVDRSGQVISLLATSDDLQETHNPQGWLIDACRRSVELETDPCSVSPLVLPIALWLDRLMVAIMNAPVSAPLVWSDAVDLCPIPHRWRSNDPVDLGITLGSTTRSWRALRTASVAGEASLCGVSPAAAAWMDDPMFARWCIGSFPDLTNLRSDVEFLASDQVAGNIALALRAAWSAFVG